MVASLFADGTFACWLASTLCARPLVGAFGRPRSEAARRVNFLKALEALRAQPAMSRR